jgi:uncharacterized protein
LLTADLVRVRRRSGALELVPLAARTRARILELGQAYLEAARASEGQPRAVLDAAFAAVPLGPREHKLAAGLRKLVVDRCTFEVACAHDPAEVRRTLFHRAAEARRSADGFDRARVVAEVATELGMPPAALEEGLFADVRAAHVLTAFEPFTAAQLLTTYELGQAQAVLLRATEVTFRVRDPDPATYRHLFRVIKFRRLLHRIERDQDGGYRIEVTGPFRLFESVTKYGLQLALVLPAVRACAQWSLEARVRWGKERTPLEFHLSGRGMDGAAGGAVATDASAADASAADPRGPLGHLPDEVRQLLERFEARKSPWRATPSADVLDLPGAGLCVPDLRFEHAETGARVYLEVLGYWSRDAVWKRVELALAGLPEPVLFAVSSRLRVSEEVLPDDAPAALYVYKGTLSAAAVEARLDALAGRSAPLFDAPSERPRTGPRKRRRKRASGPHN